MYSHAVTSLRFMRPVTILASSTCTDNPSRQHLYMCSTNELPAWRCFACHCSPMDKISCHAHPAKKLSVPAKEEQAWDGDAHVAARCKVATPKPC